MTRSSHGEQAAAEETRAVAQVPGVLQGILVVSDKMDKTVVVAVGGPVQAPAVRQGRPAYEPAEGTTRTTECGVGDRVELMETRPTSATASGGGFAESLKAKP